ncbi:MAG: hypothetical protein ABJF10_19760 [Chthoniobacter sp.]|uniref:hypothetical protein n=1 Tax=Chthoniobacter sp. TaxID=2510640 RepID=UPI0032A2EAB2
MSAKASRDIPAGEEAIRARLTAWHAQQATLEPAEIPRALRPYASTAAVWGIGSDGLRQFHLSQHSMAEILAVYDAMEEERIAFERFWKKLSAKILGGESLTKTEGCFWALQSMHAEVSAHLFAQGRPTE